MPKESPSSSIKKILPWMGYALIAAVTFTLGQVWHHRASYLSEWVSEWMQVPTTIGKVSYSKGTLHLYRVVVASPDGGPRSLFTADRVSLKVAKLGWSEVALEQVEMVHPVLTIEQSYAAGNGGSWALLLNRLEMTGEIGSPKRIYHLNDFKLVDLAYRIPFRPEQPDSISFLEVQGFSEEGPLPSRQMTAALFRYLLDVGKQNKVAEDLTKEVRKPKAPAPVGSMRLAEDPKK